MNEQILTKLVIQSSDKDGWLDRQKFAELIVQECVGAMEITDIEDFRGIELALKIKQHFGVK